MHFANASLGRTHEAQALEQFTQSHQDGKDKNREIPNGPK
jgi:hypothetical protein